METWGWLVAYVVGFGLLQLLLYRYFRRDDPSPDATPGPVEGSARRSLERPAEADGGTDADEARHCPHCGAANERIQTFSYCRECAGPLQ